MAYRAILLHLTLKHPIEYSEHELNALVSRLPKDRRRVWHAEKSIGVVFGSTHAPDQWALRLEEQLTEFRDWTIVEVTRWCASKNGDLCPLKDWIDTNVASLRLPSEVGVLPAPKPGKR